MSNSRPTTTTPNTSVLYALLQEFFNEQAVFHASMQELKTKLASAPKVKTSAKLDYLLTPYYQLIVNPFELNTAQKATLEEIKNSDLDKSAAAVREIIGFMQSRFKTVFAQYKSTLSEAAANFHIINDPAYKSELEDINKLFEPLNFTSHLIAVVQHTVQYRSITEKITGKDAQKSRENLQINAALNHLEQETLPQIIKFVTDMNSENDHLIFRNTAISMLLDVKEEKDDKIRMSARKRSMEAIDQAIEGIKKIPLPTQHSEIQAFVNAIETILDSTTSKTERRENYKKLVKDRTKAIIEEAKKIAAKEKAIEKEIPEVFPTIQIKTTTSNIIINTESSLKAMQAKLQANNWVKIKTPNYHSDQEHIFERTVNDKTQSFVVKRSLMSTKDKDPDTYRAMLEAFAAAHPKKPLKITAANEAEYDKAKIICEEIKASNPDFAYSISHREKASAAVVAKQAENAADIPDPTVKAAPLEQKNWKASDKPASPTNELPERGSLVEHKNPNNEGLAPISAIDETSDSAPIIAKQAEDIADISAPIAKAVPVEQAGWRASVNPTSLINELPAAEEKQNTQEDLISEDLASIRFGSELESASDFDEEEPSENTPLLANAAASSGATELQALISSFNEAADTGNIENIREKLISIAELVHNNKEAEDKFIFSRGEVEDRIGQLAIVKKEQNKLKNILDEPNRQANKQSKTSDEKKSSIFSRAYKGLKSRYKDMSLGKKIAFWIGTGITVAAVAGIIVGLTVATGGAAGGGFAALFGGLTVAGSSAIAGAISGTFAITRIARDPTKAILPTESEEKQKTEEVEMEEIHSSNYSIRQSLGTEATHEEQASVRTSRSNSILPESKHDHSVGATPSNQPNSLDDSSPDSSNKRRHSR